MLFTFLVPVCKTVSNFATVRCISASGSGENKATKRTDRKKRNDQPCRSSLGPKNSKECVMLNLTVVIPDSLASILKNAVARRATSPDSVVTAELSQYFQTGRHRAYQVSTSAALVQGVSAGAVSSRKLLANGDFGLGTFEHLDGDRCLSAFTWTTGRM